MCASKLTCWPLTLELKLQREGKNTGLHLCEACKLIGCLSCSTLPSDSNRHGHVTSSSWRRAWPTWRWGWRGVVIKFLGRPINLREHIVFLYPQDAQLQSLAVDVARGAVG